MGQFSQLEFNNSNRGWIEEVALMEFTYEASLFGFIRRVTFVVGNNVNHTPVIDSGTTTAGTATTLTDSAAEWLRLHIQPGDIVTNGTDNETWEVVTVDSDTQLTVQLIVGVGTWAASETYSIEARNPEDIYVPYTTEIRCTGRSGHKVFFTGVVEASVPEGDFELRVTAVARDSELRDGSPVTDAAAAASRSHVIQDALGDKVGGTIGQFLFPLVSSFEGEPGLDHSPNLNQVIPDFSKNTRNALPLFLDLAKSDLWCPDVLREPTLPTAASTFDTNDTDNELTVVAQGSQAQSFQVSTHHLVSKVGLRLKLIEGVGGNLVGNIYIRIEANDLSGDINGLNIPSGELVTPWAESNLVNMQNVSTGANGAVISFLFDQPIALRINTTYWIVLQYQENLATYVAGVDYIAWRSNAAGGYAGGYVSVYSAGAWLSNSTPDFCFEIMEHTDAVWYYDVGTATWSNHTTAAIAVDAVTFSWMPPGTDDRVYIRTAGPIYGLDLTLVTTFATPLDYGAFTIKYYGDNGAKAVGFHTGGSSTTVLTDANVDFRRTGVVVGDVIHNTTNDAYSVITAIGATTLTMTALSLGSGSTWELGHGYAVLGLETVDSGTSTSGSDTNCTDTAATFAVTGVKEGDLCVNVTDSQLGIVTAYTATSLTLGGATAGFGTDAYKILSRWRTVDLKTSEPSFMAAGTVRLEWVIPSNWVSTFLEAGMPESVSTGFTDVDDMRGYWISIQCASIPATTLALVDALVPLPGAGFTLAVTDQTHEDVIVAAGGVDDGAGGAAFLTDTSEDFITTHGILVGDIVENLTDGSRATITSITSTTAGLYNTINGTLTGGSGNVWDVNDKYRILRNRYRVRYARNGARPWGLPANFGLALRAGSGIYKQMKPIYEWSFSQSIRSTVNRVTVRGRTAAGALIAQSANNLRAQRESKRVSSRSITDYSIRTDAEALTRAKTELARLSNASERGNVELYGLPWFTRVHERLNWSNSAFGVGARMDGSGSGLSVYKHTTGANNAFLTDTKINFAKWGVEVGDLVTNITDGSSATITSISTTTNENDSINGTLIGGTDNDWDVNDTYRIEERTYIQVGDLIRVKVNDEDSYIDSDYIVTGMKYSEPSFKCILRISKSLTSPTVGDQQTQAEIDQKTRDVADQASQRGSY